MLEATTHFKHNPPDGSVILQQLSSGYLAAFQGPSAVARRSCNGSYAIVKRPINGLLVASQ